MASDPGTVTPEWIDQIEPILKGASLTEIKANLPTLIELIDFPDPKVRSDVMFVLYALSSRTDANRRVDLTVTELLVPYLPRLVAHLSDPNTPMQRMTFLVVASFSSLRPSPPELLQLTLDLLKSPNSTQQRADTTSSNPSHKAPSLGAQLLWIILPAGATFDRNPSTGITEGRDTPEVQTAIIDFIHRSDHTSESRAETLRALSLSQVQNPAVNAALLPWLTASDQDTQMAVLGQLRRVPLPLQDYTRALVAVGNLVADPLTSTEVRSAANAILRCWQHDLPNDSCPSHELVKP